MLTHNEYGGAQGGYPVAMGGGGFGFGESGILGLIALLALFRGNLFGGNHEGANSNIAEIQNQLGNIRADIGDVKYGEAKDLLSQTNALMMQYQNGQFQNAQAIWATTSKLQECCCATQNLVQSTSNGLEKSILIQGFQNQLANAAQTTQLQKAIDDCCCNTNNNMLRLNYETMLREKDCCCETQKQFAEVKALIKNTALETELFSLRRDSERSFIKDEINRSTGAAVNATIGHWWADRSFNGNSYASPPYFYSQPAV